MIELDNEQLAKYVSDMRYALRYERCKRSESALVAFVEEYRGIDSEALRGRLSKLAARALARFDEVSSEPEPVKVHDYDESDRPTLPIARW